MTWLLETMAGGAGWVLRALASKVGGLRFSLAIGFFLLVCLIDRFTVRRMLGWTGGTGRSAFASLAIYLIGVVAVPVLLAWAGELRTLYEALHVPHVPTSTWERAPSWLGAIVAVIAYDFANYWNHRAMHWRWIWPIHAIHHSDPEVNPLTTLRVHPFEGVFMASSYVFFVSWLGLPSAAIGAGGLLIMLHNQYVHVNVDWNHGPLALLVASPRFHRWHHADHPLAHGKNLANICPLFDVIFGTYYNPGPCREPMGAGGVPPNDVAKLLLYPLSEWARMLAHLVRRRDRDPRDQR
jgi:sterol desaturase/sphingolipid hydroxylase (fatty acid hydroxylase superfamily)